MNKWVHQKRQHDSVEVKFIFPGGGGDRGGEEEGAKKRMGRGSTDSTKACLSRKMQPVASRCHLKLERGRERGTGSGMSWIQAQ